MIADPTLAVKVSSLLDDEKCFAFVRQMRWPSGVRCPTCESDCVNRNGHDDTQKYRQRYVCKSCHARFDDLSGTIFANRHQDLKIWILCLYFMGLNLSNTQIAAELGLCASDVQAMAEDLRKGIEAKTTDPQLDGVVELDEVYVVAGHKGQPDQVRKKGAHLVAGD